MDLPIIIEDEHLGILETFDLALALLKGRELCEGGQVLQFVFLGHGREQAGVLEIGVGWFQL